MNVKNKVSFIENKDIDFKIIEQLLNISKSKNHYANNGPVQNLLEKKIKKIINLNNKHSVIMCNSATSGIHLLVNYFDYKKKKK